MAAEFIRFTRAGEIDRRVFRLNTDAPSGDYRNPVLMAGDVIRVRETSLTKSMSVMDEIQHTHAGLYSPFSILRQLMTSDPAPNLVQAQISQAEIEIDLRMLAAALGRQKKLIAGIAGAIAH